jgi:hypothetical protein
MAQVRQFEAVAPDGSTFQVWAESPEQARQFFPVVAATIQPTEILSPAGMVGPRARLTQN